MTNLIEQVKQKQTKIQALQKEATKKQGRKEQLLKQLLVDFAVKTKEEALALRDDFRKVLAQNDKTLEEIDQELAEIIQGASRNNASTPAGTTD